jgi:methylase of polypeptide subunit release factors
LAGLIIDAPVGTAMDLGTGGGIQVLHLARHAGSVIATDVNPRALAMARLTLGLSEVDADLRLGDRFDPLADQRVDLIVCNPPLVVGPSSRFIYRDSALTGDALCAGIVEGSVRHLTEGGWCQVLAHWLHVRGQDWRERVGGWLPLDADAWVVQREVLDPPAYVEMWLTDSGDIGTEASTTHYDEWLDWFDASGVEAVGMGWITVRRTDAFRHVRIEDLRQRVEQPVGRAVVETFESWRWSDAVSDEALLEAVLTVPAHVQLVQTSSPASGGWSPQRPVLVQRARMAREAPTDAFGALLVGALDGRTTLRQALTATARSLEVADTPELADGVVGAVRALLDKGFLAPPNT